MTLEYPELPIVVDNYDGMMISIDAAIIEAALDHRFFIEFAVPGFELHQKKPELVYQLTRAYMGRGFMTKYDGATGTMRISWDHPNMTALDVKNIRRASVNLIDNLGYGFTAALVYLCMTNGMDLRAQTPIALRRSLTTAINEAATLGNTEVTFGFPGVPHQIILSLYRELFTYLNETGFGLKFDNQRQLFVVSWDPGTPISLPSGSSMEVDVE